MSYIWLKNDKIAFEVEQVVNLDCAHVGMSDCKMIAVKLRVCVF